MDLNPYGCSTSDDSTDSEGNLRKDSNGLTSTDRYHVTNYTALRSLHACITYTHTHYYPSP